MFKVHQVINGIDLNDGGAQKVVRDLHEGLIARGISSHLVSLQDCKGGDIPQNTTSFGLSSSYDPRCLLKLRSYASTIAASDIIHAHLFPTSAHVSTLARCGYLSGKRVFTEHSTSNGRRRSMLGAVIDNHVYPKFDRIIAISNGVEDELLKARPSLDGRTVVVENGIDLRFHAPIVRPRHKGPIRIISVGRLTDVKNYPTALKALAKLNPGSFTYEIFGDGPERAALAALTDDLGLSEQVRFRGFVSDLGPELEAADIFLIPSKWEGFGLAAVEAMNTSLPIIASDVPGLREVLGSDCAILVDPNSSNQIADAISRLCDVPDMRATMGKEGFKRSTDFSLNRSIDHHIDLYSALAEEAVQ